MKILAIETSCDETAVAVLEIKKKDGQPQFRILSNVVASQIKIHSEFGGVVPNLAKREHQKNLIPALMKALRQSKLIKIFKLQKPRTANCELRTLLKREPELLERALKFLEKYEKPKIDLIAVTRGPGLEPALWMGINFAKALACAWNKSLVGVNHMEGHLFSIFLKKNREENFQFSIFNFQFPAVALLVSGGHTELVLITNWLKYKVIGETRDDAAGEAFDKVARLLDLGYPGGPAIAAEAAKFPNPNFQFPNSKQILTTNCELRTTNFQLPRPMLNSKDYDFSFSGLKTAVLYLLQNLKKDKQLRLSDSRSDLIPATAIAAEFQQAVIDVLIAKTIRAAKEYKAKTIILAGGVAANKELQKQMKKAIQKQLSTNGSPRADALALGEPTGSNINFQLPTSKFCGDNAAMIALAAYFRQQKNLPKSEGFREIKADGNLNF